MNKKRLCFLCLLGMLVFWVGAFGLSKLFGVSLSEGFNMMAVGYGVVLVINVVVIVCIWIYDRLS